MEYFSRKLPRGFTYTELSRENLKYTVGELVYLKPLDEILRNPRITEYQPVEGSDNLISFGIDGDSNIRLPIGLFGKPIRITATDTIRVDGIQLSYYVSRDHDIWFEEFMVTNNPLLHKRLKALKYLREGGANG